MNNDFIEEDTGGDVVPAESTIQKSKGRVATSECPDCHYRFPKPEMHQYTEYVESGRSSGVSVGVPNKKRSMNPRFSSRTYRRKKTFWVCNECHKKRVKKEMEKSSQNTSITLALIIFALIVSAILYIANTVPLN